MANGHANLFPNPTTDPKKADIVICLDVTGSMQPCINGIKNNLIRFVDELRNKGNIDPRLRLIAYRDKHDVQQSKYLPGKRVCEEPWLISEFTSDLNEFINWLNHKDAQAHGGGDDPESTLDALYIAINNSKWRTNAHRSIILFTDDDTHPQLHESTYPREDRGLAKIRADFQTMPNALLYMVVPRFPAYEKIGDAMIRAERKIIATYVKQGTGLEEIDWGNFLEMLGKTVTTSASEAQPVPARS